MTLAERLLSEDPDHAYFSGGENLSLSFGFSDPDAITFGTREGKFLWGYSNKTDPDPDLDRLFPGIGAWTHQKMLAQAQYSPEGIKKLADAFTRIHDKYGMKVFFYDFDYLYERGEAEEEDIDAAGPAPCMDDVDAYDKWQERVESAKEDRLSAEYEVIQELRDVLGIIPEHRMDDSNEDEIVQDENGEDVYVDTFRPRMFELPGRAWFRKGMLFVSFWGSASSHGEEGLARTVQHLVQAYGEQPSQIWIQDQHNSGWHKFGQARKVLSREAAEEIEFLSRNLHTASPEDKERIRAQIARLRGDDEEPGTKLGAGSKRVGRAASAAGFPSPAAFGAARRAESLIRELEQA